MKSLDKNKCYITRKMQKELWDKYYALDEEIKETTIAMGISDSIDSDLRENPEFMELRVKAMYTLPAQKRELFQKLNNVVIIEEMEEYKNFDGITVIMGSTVLLEIDGEEEQYTITGTEKGDLKNNILSAKAGLAEAILYHKIDDVVPFNDMIIKILKVEKADI